MDLVRISISVLLLCFFSTPIHAEEKKAPILLITSVVWEGSQIEFHNLNALTNFRKEFPTIPVTHFVSPAYYHRTEDEVEKNKTMIRSVIERRDFVGVNLTAWKSETDVANVVFRDGPTFFGHAIPRLDCKWDCGREVPPSVYPPKDIQRILRNAKNTIEKHHSTKVNSLHVHGWMAHDQILHAAVDAGFQFDYSAVSPQVVQEKLYQYPIYPWIKHNWRHIQPLHQPFIVTTPAGPITEIGNFLASVDYLSEDSIYDYFKKLLLIYRTDETKPIVMHLSLKMESAYNRLPHLKGGLKKIFNFVEQQNIFMVPYTFSPENKDLQQNYKAIFVRRQSAH